MSRKVKLVNFVYIILWMMVIFYFSSQPKWVSNDLSVRITENILKVSGISHEGMARINTWKATVEIQNNILRDYAHVTVFFVLSILTINALVRLRIKARVAYGATVVVCMIYAMLDEFHQTFVPGRGLKRFDLMYDLIGVVLGIGVYLLITWAVKFIKVRSKKLHLD